MSLLNKNFNDDKVMLLCYTLSRVLVFQVVSAESVSSWSIVCLMSSKNKGMPEQIQL